MRPMINSAKSHQLHSLAVMGFGGDGFREGLNPSYETETCIAPERRQVDVTNRGLARNRAIARPRSA
jgi:hypothetical protein